VTFQIHDGLAVYQVGAGAPVLVLPYPHAGTLRPMGEDRLPQLLAGLGRKAITFDPPGAYRSTRPMSCEMAEMLDSAAESLAVAGADPPVDVVGHSMGALCALGLAVERPDLVRRLVLIGACSGFAAVRRWSVPHNWSPWRDREWWQCLWWGIRQMTGTGNLAVYNKLANLVESASVVDRSYAEYFLVEPGDHRKPPLPRARWLRSVRRVEYRHRLHEVQAPTLLLVGRHDPQTPLPCANELAAGIPRSRAVVFAHSGHAPFLEETARFTDVVGEFLAEPRTDSHD